MGVPFPAANGCGDAAFSGCPRSKEAGIELTYTRGALRSKEFLATSRCCSSVLTEASASTASESGRCDMSVRDRVTQAWVGADFADFHGTIHTAHSYDLGSRHAWP